MPKDMKIGMFLGLILVSAVMLWLFVGPGINLRATALNLEIDRQTIALPEASDSSNKTEVETKVRQENNQLSSKDEQSEELDLAKNWQPKKIKSQRFHIIREGETLSEISHHYYGSATKWQKILDANKHLIQDVNKLRPGTKIIVPE